MMSVAEQFLADQMHPTVIIGAYRQAMDDMLEILRDQISVPVDVDSREEMLKIVRSSVGTKFVHHWLVVVVVFSFSFFMAINVHTAAFPTLFPGSPFFPAP